MVASIAHRDLEESEVKVGEREATNIVFGGRGGGGAEQRLGDLNRGKDERRNTKEEEEEETHDFGTFSLCGDAGNTENTTTIRTMLLFKQMRKKERRRRSRW